MGVIQSVSGTSLDLSDQLELANLNCFSLCKNELFFGVGDATTVSGKFLDVVNALPRHSATSSFDKLQPNFPQEAFKCLTAIVHWIIKNHCNFSCTDSSTFDVDFVL